MTMLKHRSAVYLPTTLDAEEAPGRRFALTVLRGKVPLTVVDSLELAETLANLGDLALKREHLAMAEASYRRALVIQEEQAPGSQDEALSLQGLGLTARADGDLEAAQRYLGQALSMLVELAVENLYVADLHHSLGQDDRGAFLCAGARSIVATYWEVADGSTADLMMTFCEALLEGHDKEEALRCAKLRLLHDQPHVHPCYWAGFQITGDCR